MVMIKRAAAAIAAEAGAGRFASRLRPLDSAAGGNSGARGLTQFKAARHRADQHSAVSIAGSGGGSQLTGRSTPQRTTSGNSSSPRFAAAASSRRHHPPQAARPPPRSAIRYGSDSCGGSGDSDRFHYPRRRRNCGASNSALGGAPSPDWVTGRSATVDTNAGLRSVGADWRYGRSSRRSYSTQRQGKTVSITASQEARTRSEIDRTASSRVYLPCDMTTKSIIKMRPLPGDRTQGGHNNDAALKESRGENNDLTPHQLRDQKIFSECRFIPADPFYKKVLVAPNQDRQFFASPRCSRVPGSRMLYDIAGENARHHQDCNFDSTRDMLKKACPTYCRPSQFRHIY